MFFQFQLSVYQFLSYHHYSTFNCDKKQYWSFPQLCQSIAVKENLTLTFFSKSNAKVKQPVFHSSRCSRTPQHSRVPRHLSWLHLSRTSTVFCKAKKCRYEKVDVPWFEPKSASDFSDAFPNYLAFIEIVFCWMNNVIISKNLTFTVHWPWPRQTLIERCVMWIRCNQTLTWSCLTFKCNNFLIPLE